MFVPNVQQHDGGGGDKSSLLLCLLIKLPSGQLQRHDFKQKTTAKPGQREKQLVELKGKVNSYNSVHIY